MERIQDHESYFQTHIDVRDISDFAMLIPVEEAEVSVRQAEAYKGEEVVLGPKLIENGVDFAVQVGENAKTVTVCKIDRDDPEIVLEKWGLITPELDQDRPHETQIFSGHLPGLVEGDFYALQVDGPNVFTSREPGMGILPLDMYNGNNILIDPYARAVYQPVFDTTNNDRFEGKAVGVIVDETFDWGDDVHPEPEDRVICELHTDAATKLLEMIPEHLRGTYAGLASDEFIGHIKEMGYTSIELMPVFDYDDAGYWGYKTRNFFSPTARYASDKRPGAEIYEFKNMVKKLHENDIEVILDVVYNHTREGGIAGPTQSLRGIDNDGLYSRDKNGNPVDHNGCGTDVDASTEHGQRLIVDSLRYWVKDMHVDAFRFDLAPVLARQRIYDGAIDLDNFHETPLIKAIAKDSILKDRLMIAEPWDMEGYPNFYGQELGHFATQRIDGKFKSVEQWKEWHGKGRNDLREIGRRRGTISKLAHVLMGMGMPEGSVNFVTAHDGFTLWDLVSYDVKHNEANGEGNKDGTDDNRSYNHGVEGDTEDPYVLNARLCAVRNMMSILLASNVTPMILDGDDRLKTKGGNNNAWNQDNDISYIPWSGLEPRQLDFQDYLRGLIQYRRAHPQFYASNAPKTRFIHSNQSHAGDHEWLTRYGVPMEYDEQWKDFVIGSFRTGRKFNADDSLTLHNVGHEAVDFALPTDGRFGGIYSKVADTYSGEIRRRGQEEKVIQKGFVTINGLTSVILRRRS